MLVEAVDQALRRKGLGCKFVPAVSDMEPLELLCRRFCPEGRAITEDARLRELYAHDAFSGKIFILDGLLESGIDVWLAFLERFAHFTRNNINDFLRTAILIPIVSGSRPIVTRGDPLLNNLVADGIVRKCDMVYYAYGQLADQERRMPAKNQLHAEIAAALALWDFEICKKLCQEDLGQLLDVCARPIPEKLTLCEMLREYAVKAGWRELAEIQDVQALWRAGVLYTFEKRAEEHSAWIALRERWNNVLTKRIWSAQVTVLFPLLEEYRRYYLEQYRDILAGVEDCQLDDLEIRQIWYHLRQHNKVAARQRAHLALMRNVRNALAHGEAISGRDLNSLLIRL
jgi:hypothetical protein